ncbi:MAG: type IV secretion system protein [Eubacterium sp.]|nr:type IV secretion system protein [Eubacterium sp.]
MLSDLLAAALTFFCDKMDVFLTLLTTDLTTYNGGGIWDAIVNVYNVLLTVGVTLANIFVWAELIESISRWVEIRKASILAFFAIQIIIVNVIINYSKDILLTVYTIIQGVTSSVMTSTGMVTSDGTTFFHISVPDEFTEAVESLTISQSIGMVVMIIVVSIWICISTMGVLLTVYTRLFNLYLLIAISPLAFACAMSRRTRFVFTNFLKNFISVSLEAVVLVLTMYIFKQLFEQGVNVELVYEEGSTLYNTIIGYVGSTLGSAIIPGSSLIGGYAGASTALHFFGDDGHVSTASIFAYLLDMSFLFAVMVGMIKGSERIVNKVFGL